MSHTLYMLRYMRSNLTFLRFKIGCHYYHCLCQCCFKFRVLLQDYMQLLVNNFNPKTLSGLMCRNSVSVDHLGSVYDCDFNQQLQLKISGRKKTIFDVESFSEFGETDIVFDNHCYGCTAGQVPTRQAGIPW